MATSIVGESKGVFCYLLFYITLRIPVRTIEWVGDCNAEYNDGGICDEMMQSILLTKLQEEEGDSWLRSCRTTSGSSRRQMASPTCCRAHWKSTVWLCRTNSRGGKRSSPRRSSTPLVQSMDLMDTTKRWVSLPAPSPLSSPGHATVDRLLVRVLGVGGAAAEQRRWPQPARDIQQVWIPNNSDLAGGLGGILGDRTRAVKARCEAGQRWAELCV